MKALQLAAAEVFIRKHISGITNIEFSEKGDRITIDTKNVSCSINRLSELKEVLYFAKDIEVGIIALTNTLAYNIYL